MAETDETDAPAEARAILSDWSGVETSRVGRFWSLSAYFRGAHHSTAGDDLVAMARHLDAVTKMEAGAAPPPPAVAPAPPPPPPPAAPPVTFDAKYGQPVVAAPPAPIPDEPIPDALFVLVPKTVEEQERKKWLAARWIVLNAQMMDEAKPFSERRLPELKPSERVEFNALQHYMGWFS